MATVNAILRTSYKSKDGTYPIVIRIEHARRQRLIAVGHKVKKEYWKDGTVSTKHPDAVIINSAIATKQAEAKRYLADCQLHGKPIHLDLIGTGRQSYSFTEYLQHRAGQYRLSGSPVMGQKIDRFVIELKAAFCREVYFSDLTPDSLRVLEQYMIAQKNVENTRHKKFKMLGEFYGRAVDEGKAPLPNPFKGHKIAPQPTRKEKLTEGEIAAIETLQLNPGPVNDARNLFLFSFYCKGIRFGNCVSLRTEDIRDGRIYIQPSKKGKPVSVKIHTRLKEIIDQYQGEEFVFPFIDHIPSDELERIRLIASQNTIVNKNLKIVARLAKIKKTLTFHIARHSFAYQLKGKTDSIHVITDALGHGSSAITEVYLKALDDEILDKEMEKLYGR